jgi:hypothetical protein
MERVRHYRWLRMLPLLNLCTVSLAISQWQVQLFSNLSLTVASYTRGRCTPSSDRIFMIVLLQEKATPVNTAIVTIEKAVRKLMHSDFSTIGNDRPSGSVSGFQMILDACKLYSRNHPKASIET